MRAPFMLLQLAFWQFVVGIELHAAWQNQPLKKPPQAQVPESMAYPIGAHPIPHASHKVDGAVRHLLLVRTRFVLQVCHKRGLKLMGHSADGDARVRQLTYRLCRDAPVDHAEECISCSHPLIQLMLPCVNSSLEGAFIFIASDWLHITWRIRQRFLNAALTLQLGGMPIVPSRLFGHHGIALGITAADTDAKNKQSLEGAPYLAGAQT